MRRFGGNLAGRVWQCVATSLLLLLLGALATPFVQAQDPEFGVPPCCRMMAGHMGCSMRLHRAMVQQMVEQYDHSHQFASLQARCPCTPLTQSNVSPHGDAICCDVGRACVVTAGTRAVIRLSRS